MKYWDASALIPLMVEEPGSPVVAPWLAEDPLVTTWGLTRVEVAEAAEREGLAVLAWPDES